MLRIKLFAPVLLLLIISGSAIAQQGDLTGKAPTELVLEIVY